MRPATISRCGRRPTTPATIRPSARGDRARAQVNATEVARNFSEVLDGVEHRHQTYVVTRAGKPIARITPVPSTNGLEVKRLLRDHAADASWPAEIAALRASSTVEERDWTG